MQLIQSETEITPTWLSELFGIDPGVIKSLKLNYLGDMPISKAFIIEIEYHQELNHPPKSLFLKLPKEELPEKAKDCGKNEVNFYTKIAARIGPAFLPQCYLAVEDEEHNNYNIVLEDLTQTHFLTQYPLPASLEYSQQAIDCLANVHAAWWDHPELQAITTPFATREFILQTNQELPALCEQFFASVGDTISKRRQKILETALENGEKIWGRYLTYQNLTLTHGDPHNWNFLLPKQTEGSIKLIDWQTYRNGVGAQDIAYYLAIQWFPDRRKEYEMDLLHRYHEKLLDYGVQHYDLPDLVYDYKWSIIGHLFLPVIHWKMKIWAGVWFHNMERIFAAYDDLNCEEIINHG